MPPPPLRYLTQPKVCLLTDHPTHQRQGPWSCPWSPGGQAEAQRHEARRGPQVYWGLHAHAHGITRGQHGYTRGGLRPQLGPRGRGVWPPPWWPRPSWVPSSWAAEGGGRWGGPRARKGEASRLVRGGTGAGGAGRPHSRDCNISNCLSTFVWLVSRISPARNISSTTV